MLMLHQAVPHVHHGHEDLHAVDEQADHHHHDHEKEPFSNFLDFLIEGHAHSYHADDFDNFRQVVKQSIEVKVFPLFTFSESVEFAIKKPDKSSQWIVYYPPGLKSISHLSSHSLRGPPILG